MGLEVLKCKVISHVGKKRKPTCLDNEMDLNLSVLKNMMRKFRSPMIISIGPLYIPNIPAPPPPSKGNRRLRQGTRVVVTNRVGYNDHLC